MARNTENTQTATDQTILARYRRAEALEHLANSMALSAQVQPHWIGDSDQFWYARTRDGSA